MNIIEKYFSEFTPAQLGQNRFVVNQFAENRQRLGSRLTERKVNGVADAETHAQMLCANNFHEVRRC